MDLKVWVLGNESRGLSARLKEIPEFIHYRIEQKGTGAESLNAATKHRHSTFTGVLTFIKSLHVAGSFHLLI